MSAVLAWTAMQAVKNPLRKRGPSRQPMDAPISHPPRPRRREWKGSAAWMACDKLLEDSRESWTVSTVREYMGVTSQLAQDALRSGYKRGLFSMTKNHLGHNIFIRIKEPVT